MATISDALAMALRHHQAGEFVAAEHIYRQILAVDPRQADALHLLGVVAFQVGKHDAAVEWIRRAIAVNGEEAAFHLNLGNVFKAQGKLDEAVGCFRRSIELNPQRAETHNNLGTALLAQRGLEEAVNCFRRALELQPQFAEALCNLGNALKEQEKLDEAIACQRRAIALKPDFAEAHYNLGTTLSDQGRQTEAIEAYRRAIELKPDLVAAYFNLGNALQAEGRLDEAIASFRRQLELRPDLPETHTNLGTALQAQGKLDEAMASYRKALALRPDNATPHHNLGNAFQVQGRFDEAMSSFGRALELNADYALAHSDRSVLRLLLGDFQRGWPEYEWRWKTNQLTERAFLQPRWEGEALEERTILLHAEQGFGDTMQFVRYAAVVKKQNPTATIIVQCPRSLEKLLARCTGIDRLIAEGDELPPFDVHSPLMSLPRIFKTTIATIPAEVPYLFADPELMAAWRERLSSVGGWRVGINWQGRSGQGEFRKRDIRLEQFAALAQLPGVSLVSLQRGEGREELVRAGERLPIVDLGDDVDTQHGAFVDTAAVMMNLDLVITSDTAVPHLAGALGVPVWLALPFVPDWRWLLNRADSPWYPTMRVFRQKKAEDWAGVFEEICGELHSTRRNRRE